MSHDWRIWIGPLVALIWLALTVLLVRWLRDRSKR